MDSLTDGAGCLTVILLTLLAFVLIFLFDLIFAWPFMLLWNWLMPVIFGLPVIGFWQSFGLLVLASFLFKSSTNINNK
jgi:hypothetical protein